jgi:hypothetical protein
MDDWKGGGISPEPAPVEEGEGRRSTWWQRRPWAGIASEAAAVGLLAAAFVAGDLVGRAGEPGRAPAAASPSVTMAATPTTIPAGSVTAPGAGPTSTPEGATPSPTAQPGHPALVFQPTSPQQCPYFGGPNPSCETFVVALFTDPGSSNPAKDTAQVTFQNPEVRIYTNAQGASQIAIGSTTSDGSYAVTLGELWFPAAGTYPYTVTVSDVGDGVSGTSSGTFQVALGAGAVASPSPI